MKRNFVIELVRLSWKRKMPPVRQKEDKWKT